LRKRSWVSYHSGYKIMYIFHDYQCSKCSHIWDDMVEKVDDFTKRTSNCPECGKKTKPSLSMPNISALSAMSPEFRAEKMKQRSKDHSVKEIRKEAEKWGKAGTDIARDGQIRNK